MKELKTFGEEINGEYRVRNRAAGVVINDVNETSYIFLSN